MLKKKELKDLIDITLWKKIQDDFSQAIKGTVFTLDKDINKIAISREFPFFCQIIQSIPKGKEFCNACWKENFEKIYSEGNKILFYYCPAGLMNIMVPIKINNDIVGCVVCCSLIKNIRNMAACRNIAHNIKVEVEELSDALNEINTNSEAEIKMFGTLLYVLSLTLPDITYQKQITEKKLSQVTILHKITQMVNSSLELEKILKSIMQYMIQSGNFNDCSIIIFDKNNDMKRYRFRESKSYMDVERIVIDEMMVTKNIIAIPDVRNDGRFKSLKFLPKSLISLPLKVRDDFIGIMNLYSSAGNWTDEEKEFLYIVANQVAVAIENSRHLDRLKELAITDKLTGLYNRRYFMDVLKRDVTRSITFRSPLSVTMLDIDFFKHYNDAHGHQKGDKVLEELAILIKKSIRKVDIAGRYGGEEFIIISPQTNSQEAGEIIEKIRKTVEEYPFYGEEKQPKNKLTISAGIVTCMDKSLTHEEIIREADKTLYKAKEAGKNRIMSTVIIDKNISPIDVQEVDEFYRKR